MSDLTPVISNNLQQLRRQKGLSLDKLSELSGVSKAMIGQIERGESNPTVNTLWKIASGLRVSLGSLIDVASPPVELVHVDDVTPIKDGIDTISLTPLFSFDQNKGFEIFSVTLAPNYTHTADAHVEGSEEYVLMVEGTVEVIVNEMTYRLAPGDALRFKSDLPHAYRNPTDSPVRFQNIIYYTGS